MEESATTEQVAQPKSPDVAQGSSGRDIARASGVIAFFTLFSRILGLLRDMAIAVYFGAGFQTDAFFVAFKVPNLLRRLVAEGSLSTAFVPVFTDELAKDREHAKRAFAGTAGFCLLLTLAFTVLGMTFAEEITFFFAPGFGVDSEKSALASSLMRILFPYVIIVSLTALCGGALNALGHFASPAAAPALLNIFLISSIFLVSGLLDEPIYALAWSVLVGGLVAFWMQLVYMRRLEFPFCISSPFGNRSVLKLILLMLPTVFSASVYQLVVFVNTLLASLLEEGSVSWLYYADRLFQFPLGVFSIALATALLPALSKLATQKNYRELSRRLTMTLGWVSFITIPATAGLVVLAEAIVRVIYEHGSFSPASAQNTALALQAYALGLWSISCQTILIRTYIASKNAKLPALITSLTILVNILFALLFMGPSRVSVDSQFAHLLSAAASSMVLLPLGHVGLALSGSIASLCSLFFFVRFLPRIGFELDLRQVGSSLLRIAIASALMCIALVVVKQFYQGQLARLLVGIPIGVVVYAGATYALGLEEAKQFFVLLPKLLNRITKRRRA